MFEDDPELQAFRLRYREFLDANAPRGWRVNATSPDTTLEIQRSWLRTLVAGGWGAAHWPTEYGGMGATLAQQIVMQQENARAGAPAVTMFGMALVHVAATLLEFGTPEQRHEHMPSILRGDEIWCQGFSEPGAGSDLAALSTRAVRDGDNYIINGQKIWSSGANRADWCLLLVRTDPIAVKHKGITFVLLDLHSPGIEIRPIKSLLGSQEFCEVFFTDVVVPVSNRIGEENEGWHICQTTLATERGPYLLPVVNKLRGECAEMGRLAEAIGTDHAAQVAASFHAEVTILSELLDRTLIKAAFGKSGNESSILKVYYSELAQRLTTAALEMVGLDAQLSWPEAFDLNSDTFDGSWGMSHYWSWSWTIAGGSNEIQRNIIGERVLGLPREPRPEAKVR